MKYTFAQKIEALQDQIDRLEILADLLEDEDVEGRDEALLCAKILRSIKAEYEEREKNTYL